MQPGNQNSNKYPWGNNEVSVNTEQPTLGQPVAPPNYPAYDTPKKQSFFKQNKKFSIIVGGCLGFLLIMTIVAVIASMGSSNQSPAVTSESLTSHSNDEFSIAYASSMKIEFDERATDSEDWNLVFTEDPEISDYEVKVTASKTQPDYAPGEESVTNLLDVDTEIRELATTEVSLVGQTAQKAIAKFTGDDDREYYVVSVQAQSGEKWVQINATYPVDNTAIHDSFDAMVSSIKLK